MTNDQVIIIGGGIAGLTAAALLAHEGLQVVLLEAHYQTGGCAGTFKRGQYIFDVGATQVAGFETGGIHERIFRYLGYSLPSSEVLDLACVVQLEDGSRPIHLWNDPEKWQAERAEQFPGSEKFWRLCSQIHQINWSFAKREPVLPVRNLWDFRQFFQALRPNTFLAGFLSNATVMDLLRLCSCEKDLRLKKFLDLQIKLYSQESIDRTAALYGATVLQMAQKPLGLWHLNGSMQKLSDILETSLTGDKGELLLRHKVVGLSPKSRNKPWKVDVLDHNKKLKTLYGSDVIFTLPPQCLLQIFSNPSFLPLSYCDRLMNLPKGNGAVVLYGAIDRKKLPPHCPCHLQLDINDPGSLFLSISRENDGRAPAGQATLIASLFAEVDFWNSLSSKEYQDKKQIFLDKMRKAINAYLKIDCDAWLHIELSTPRSFAKWTGRPLGIVGGLGQHPRNFGPYGLSSRTPIEGLWLCGDSIYPGEGTAGVSLSALQSCRQLMKSRGKVFNLPF